MWSQRLKHQWQNSLRNILIARQYQRVRWVASGGILASLGGASWYYHQYWHEVELSPDYFTKYRVSHNAKLDSEHFLMELTPLKPQRVNLWSATTSNKLWSVEVKQPEIMVVRNYTPLPLKVTTDKKVQVLPDGKFESGKLLFYLKKYRYGEVARWLSELPEGHIVEVRGPFVDFELPPFEEKRDRSFLWDDNAKLQSEQFLQQPYDIAAFTAGTGIAPIMQLLLKENPFPGRILMFHSCHADSDLGPLRHLLDKLQDYHRAKLYLFESQRANDLRKISDEVLKLIPSPMAYHAGPFVGLNSSISPILSLVCGPDSYITTVSGVKYDLSQGPIEGLLGQKGWNNSNVYKLS
ncbi:LANO_0H23002g1_1 [Lachancea nothofagi CBS 11611]|uniref:LANO_0H23002g1_1 n=1 Tax=Lachancea nothofagi CBS 11611 TaxID=1266666 RepID=A0A1G4KNP3_9SACH|nr:LANO_0H23002g1_1 [Lachancea nothofagi CBS 11611]